MDGCEDDAEDDDDDNEDDVDYDDDVDGLVAMAMPLGYTCVFVLLSHQYSYHHPIDFVHARFWVRRL